MQAKVVLSGEIKKAVTLKGIGATKGAREAIEAAGGKVEARPEPPTATLALRNRRGQQPVNESARRPRRSDRASASCAAACCS